MGHTTKKRMDFPAGKEKMWTMRSIRLMATVVSIILWGTCFWLSSTLPAYAEKIPALARVPADLTGETQARLNQQRQELDQEYYRFQKAADDFNALPAEQQNGAEFKALQAWRTQYVDKVRTFNRDVAADYNVFVSNVTVSIMRDLDSIPLVMPIVPAELSISFGKLAKRDQTSKMGLRAAEFVYGVTDVLLVLGKGTSIGCNILIAAGRTFIAQEDGAYVYLVKQEALYERALEYQKHEETSKIFTSAIRAIKEHKPIPDGITDEMRRAAYAILDPKLGNGGGSIPWDALFSPEAKSAALTQAVIELGGFVAGHAADKAVKGLMSTRQPAFLAGSKAIAKCKIVLQNSEVLSKANRLRLDTAAEKANETMANSFRLATEKSAGHATAIFFTDKLEGKLEGRLETGSKQ